MADPLPAAKSPGRKRPPVLVAPAPPQDGAASPPHEPLLGRWREAAREVGGPGRESYLVIIESLLPDPQGALKRLLEQARAEGAQLVPHWSLAAKDRGSNTTEITFMPTDEGKEAPTLLASGTLGAARVEIEVGLAHANDYEDVSFKRTLVRRKKFAMLVLSHEEGVH